MIGPRSYAGLMGQDPAQFDENDQFNPQAPNPVVTLANGQTMQNGTVPNMSVAPTPTDTVDPAAFGLPANLDTTPTKEPGTNWAAILSGTAKGAGLGNRKPVTSDIYGANNLYGKNLYGSLAKKPF